MSDHVLYENCFYNSFLAFSSYFCWLFFKIKCDRINANYENQCRNGVRKVGSFRKGIAVFLAICVTVLSMGIDVQAYEIADSERATLQENNKADVESVKKAEDSNKTGNTQEETKQTRETEPEDAERIPGTEPEEKRQTEETGQEGEQTQKTEQTQETEQNSGIELKQGTLNFIMVESSSIKAPGVQNIAASLGGERSAVDEAELTYRNMETGEVFTIAAAEFADNMARFTIEFTEDAQRGVYALTGITYQVQGETYEIVFDALGMEVSFGVNQEGDSQPDEMLIDDETLQEVEANVVSLDENGNTVSEQSIGDVLEGVESGERMARSGQAGTNASKKMVIVLDPGHDSVHAGARRNGCKEEELVLKIAQYCKTELQKYAGVTVYMTRTSNACPNGGYAVDSGTCNARRVELAVAKKADVYVSLHLNSNVSSTPRGVGVYYPNNNYRPKIGEEGKGLATDIYKKLSALGLTTWAGGILTHDSEDNTQYPDGSLADYLGVIRRSKLAGIPAVLVEHAFLSNAADVSEFLNSNAKLKKLGVADAKAIAGYYGLSVKGAVPQIAWIQSKNSQRLLVSWEEAGNAASYQIYRSTSANGKYKKVGETEKNSYLDKSVKEGITYYYKVCAISTDGKESSYSNVHSGTPLAKPEISSIVSKAGSQLKLKWKAVSGAEKYEVYRSGTKDGKYTKIATTTGRTYTDRKRTTQKEYFYKIRARGGEQNGYSSYCTIKSGWAVKKAVIRSVSSHTSTSLRLKWKMVANAYGYRIQRSTSKKGTYKTVAELKKNKTYYVDKGVKAKKKYYYRIQALNRVGGVTGCGSYSNPVSGSTITSTALVYVKSNSSTAMEIKWKKDKGAYAYSVKRSTKKKGPYEKIAEIRDHNITTYEDKNVIGGQRYYYVVETIVNKKGVKGYSGDSKPFSAVSLQKVDITGIQEVGNGFLLSWEAVSGANCYEIMRSTRSKGGFTEIAKVRGTDAVNYTDTNVTAGVKYYYRIRAVSEGKNTGYGSYGKVAESNVYKTELP